MKKFMTIMLAVMLTLSVAACSAKDDKNQDGEQPATIGAALQKDFENAAATSTSDAEIAEALSKTEYVGDLVLMEVQPGYLNGFDAEIDKFTSGYVFQPMIGAIPFVGYVFTSDDPDALLTQLKENANMRWNVCTEADEMVSEIKGNLVFFAMVSNETEE